MEGRGTGGKLVTATNWLEFAQLHGMGTTLLVGSRSENRSQTIAGSNSVVKQGGVG